MRIWGRVAVATASAVSLTRIAPLAKRFSTTSTNTTRQIWVPKRQKAIWFWTSTPTRRCTNKINSYSKTSLTQYKVSKIRRHSWRGINRWRRESSIIGTAALSSIITKLPRCRRLWVRIWMAHVAWNKISNNNRMVQKRTLKRNIDN